VDAAQRQAATLTFFWILHGRLQDGLGWLRHALALSDLGMQPNAVRLEVVVGLSLIVGEDRPVSLARLEAEIPKARAIGRLAHARAGRHAGWQADVAGPA
jgi:hypothetical protein